MRVLVTGATGVIGRAVVSALQKRDDSVVVLTREPAKATERLGAEVTAMRWGTPAVEQPPAGAFDGVDAVVHLLGEPVDQRWNDAARQRIRDSRVRSTELLVRALSELPDGRRPGVLVSQSATGYYGATGPERLDERAPAGDDFLAGVVDEWERAAQRAGSLMRVVVTRTGVVLSPHGGALARMLPFFGAGVGGPVAGGHQYVSWVHGADVVGALLHVLDRDPARGAVNVTAPEPVTNAQLSRALGAVLRRPAVLPVPALALRLLYGEMASIVTTGQRVLPARLRELGYEHRYPDLDGALRDALGRA